MAGPVRNAAAAQPRKTSWRSLLVGLIIGALGGLGAVIFVGMPLAIGHRRDLLLERLYGDLAVGIAAQTQAGAAQNPVAQNRRALEAGRLAYTGSCAVCHGVNGDGKGAFGTALYPPATNLQAHDTQEKSDAQLFWIIKNGLSFLGMPAFGDQYDDQQTWALVAYTRSLGNASSRRNAEAIPTPVGEQLAMADPGGDAAHRGAAVYFAQGCQMCHGATGDAPGELHLRRGGREAPEAVRRGRRGMPTYGPDQISEAQLDDLVAYLDTFAGGRR
jgi:mono/diheme cytochrome c family protein